MDGQAEQWVHPAIYKEVMETREVGLAQAAGHDNAGEMARAMEAARRCEIVADTTQAINQPGQDPQPMGECQASPSQVLRGGPVGGPASVSGYMYVNRRVQHRCILHFQL